MALEVVLAGLLTWTTATGEIRMQPLRGTFSSYEVCVEAVTRQISAVIDRYGVAPVPSGELCRASEPPPPPPFRSPTSEESVENARQRALEARDKAKATAEGRK